MNLAPILDPDRRKPGPKPAKVDLRNVFAIGTAVWVLMLGLVSVMLHVFHTRIWTFSFLTCIIGIVVGLFLLAWERWYRPEYTKLSEDPEETDEGLTAETVNQTVASQNKSRNSQDSRSGPGQTNQ